MTIKPDFLTTGDVALVLYCCARTVAKLFDQGEFKGHRISSGDRRILVSGIREYIDRVSNDQDTRRELNERLDIILKAKEPK